MTRRYAVAQDFLRADTRAGFSVSTTSAVELLALVNSFRPWVVEAGQAQLEKFIAEAHGRDTLDAWILWLDIREKTVDRGMRGDKVGTNFDLYFFPDGERTLGLMVCEHQAWKDMWLMQPGVSEYAERSYMDRPQEQSEEAWSERKESWARVLGDRELIEAGLKIKVSVEGGPQPLGLISR